MRYSPLPHDTLISLNSTPATNPNLLNLNGIHPKVVQEMLGHSTIAITLDIYSHLMPTMQEEAADKMGEFLRAG
ncbi:MAG: hypothetical protein QGI09_03330 [Dehalococcoidia bacterium]|jgi:integrase|nr:hypothetical protein [Dehalococcoidia bacterium]